MFNRLARLALNALLSTGAVLALLSVFLALPALAQTSAEVPAAVPFWQTALLGLAPLIITALVAIHPALKLAAFLHARAADANASVLAKNAYLVGESAAKSLDHFLELTQQDAKDLLDPAKRAMAIKHIEDAAKSEAVPALAAAANTVGAGFVTGAASQAIDKAIAAATGSSSAALAAPSPPAA